MKFKSVFLCLLFASCSLLTQGQIVPANTATHTAIASGSWFDTLTWSSNTIPDDAAIVVIPVGKSVTYEGSSDAHIFAIQVNGEFHCKQTNVDSTTKLIFDSFFSGMMSKVTFKANGTSDGKIDVIIKPFDIEAHKAGTSGFSQSWNTNATTYFSDRDTTYRVERTTTTKMRYNTLAEALAANTQDSTISVTQVDDGNGVWGRYGWDSTQISLGLMTMGQLEIIGQAKTNMVRLGANAARNQSNVVLESIPSGWKVGDKILITRGGEQSTTSKGNDLAEINTISGVNITTVANLSKNHEGRASDNLQCYVGNMTRNIIFRSFITDTISQRGHMMAMMSDTNVQIRNAAFLDMGRTDKSRMVDDVVFGNWVQPPTQHSKLSALGQECIEMKKNPKNEITNMRGRYSVHLHKLKAKASSNIATVKGNVVWGNPGWAITHHDSYADISENNVYQVKGAGIVSETGSELGFWDNNLVVEIDKGSTADVYEGVTIYDDHSFSGEGLALKGRGVICRGNVIADAPIGIGVMNMNASRTNTDRVDAAALATLRPGHEIEQWPLSYNGYSIEGDDVMPVEVPLIFENNTIIWANLGFKSIERDMGVNHESRSIFDGFYLWGINQGIVITYQADYSFKDVFISGKNGTTGLGVYMWKHSHNHLFEDVKMANLESAVAVSKLVESANGNQIKTRNNGITPWVFIDLVLDNVTNMYEIENEDPASTYNYVEHTDNTIHLSSSDISERPVTFTILDSSNLEVDIATSDFKFEIDGVITDNAGAYDMGILQAPAQGTLREGYPTRIYEFASQSKFEEYLTNNGLYKDTANNDQLYFIIDEYLPNRVTYEYEKFPVRVKIKNAPSTGVYANPMIEPAASFLPKNHMISRFGTGSMSSVDNTITVDTFSVDASASKAIDGNINGRINAQQYQRGFVPIGSIAETTTETEPWYELDLGEMKVIDFIDVWSKVGLNARAIEPVDPNFKDFYVLVSDSSFGSKGLAAARAQASSEYSSGSTSKRRFFRDNLNDTGRYVRIQYVGSTKLAISEIEVIGRDIADPLCLMTNELPTDAGTYTSSYATKDGDWVCYCDANDKLLLALDTTGTGALVSNSQVSLEIGTDTTTSWINAGGIITNQYGGAIFNRKWNVSPTTQPSNNVKVKYFFTEAEFQALKDTIANHNGGNSTYVSSIASPTDLQMYKLYGSSPFQDPHSSGATGIILMNGASPDTNTWAYTAHGTTDHAAEYLVSSFSGGGGGVGGGSTPLPVDWLTFNAVLHSDKSIHLNWSTASEHNVHHFEIERSYDGTSFTKIEYALATNSNQVRSYTHQDVNYNNAFSVIFYRIKQVDFNGSSSYSIIRKVILSDNKDMNQLTVFPNPSNGKLSLQWENKNSSSLTFRVSNAQGVEVYNSSTSKDAEIHILNLSHLKSGVYLLEAMDDNNISKRVKLIIR